MVRSKATTTRRVPIKRKATAKTPTPAARKMRKYGGLKEDIDVNLNRCFVSDITPKGCTSKDTIAYEIPAGVVFFCGIRDVDAAGKPINHFVVGSKGTQPLQFFMMELSETVQGYASYRGAVAVYTTIRPLLLYLQTNFDSDCTIFITSTDYASDEAQCFCKPPFFGYASYFREKIVDIAICSPQNHMVYEGWIPARDVMNPNCVVYDAVTGQPRKDSAQFTKFRDVKIRLE